VEYLNYQDQIHHDATDGGYADHHISENVVPILDRDYIAAATNSSMLPDQAPFPGGLEDTYLLAFYANHVALPL